MLEENKLKIGSKIRLMTPDNVGWKTTVGNTYEIVNISSYFGKNRYHFITDNGSEEWFNFDSQVIHCYEHKDEIDFLNFLKGY